MVDNITVQSLVEALQPKDKSKPSTFTAVVTKKNKDGTAWVQIAGSEIETPIEASTADVKSGDAVTVEWRNNRLYIAGNTSNPSAGVEAVGTVERKAVSAQQAAENASRIAGNTNQYFWHTETGTDTGAHITEVPREDFLADPTNSGGNLLARSNGIAVRDGLTELATFGASGTVIGKTGEQRVRQTATGLEFLDENDLNIALMTINNNNVEIRNNYTNYKSVVGGGFSVEGSQGVIITVNASGIFIQGHTEPIGTRYGSNGTKSVSSGTTAIKLNDTAISLGAGTWILVAGVDFPASSTGIRTIGWMKDSTTQLASRITSANAGAGANTRLQSITTFSLTAASEWYIYGIQNSGSAMSVNYYWQAVRIA